MSSHLPIGVFDSGIGGLSVVHAIRDLLPAEDLLYVADSAYVPYGERPAQEVVDRVLAIGSFLEAEGCKAVVVACNTATAIAVASLRERLTVPVIAMEPAIKPATAQTRSGVVAVLATAGTLASGRYAALRTRQGQQTTFIERECPRWVELVEQGDLADPAAYAAVHREIGPLVAAGADVFVLGCTHFPFLAALIAAAAGPEARIIDPSPAVAGQLRRQLEARSALAGHAAGRLRLLSTAPERIDSARAQLMAGTDGPWERVLI